MSVLVRAICVLGCVALHIVWSDLAEVKSLAVPEGVQTRGLGSLLVQEGLEGPAMLLEQGRAPHAGPLVCGEGREGGLAHVDRRSHP